MPIKHLVLDVWGTMLRTNIKYRQSREEAISRNILSQVSDFADEIDVKKAFANTKDLLDAYEWKTGRSIPYGFKHMLVAKQMYTPWASESVHWPLMFNELFLANSPLLFHYKIAAFLQYWVSQANTWSILSNTHFVKGEVIREALNGQGVDIKTALYTYFSDEGTYCKPHQKAFEKVIPFNITPQEVMMIGDNNLLDIAPAAKLGWQTHLIDSNESWEKLFKLLGYER